MRDRGNRPRRGPAACALIDLVSKRFQHALECSSAEQDSASDQLLPAGDYQGNRPRSWVAVATRRTAIR